MKLLNCAFLLSLLLNKVFAGNIQEYASYRKAVNAVSQMSNDAKSRAAAKKYGLDILNITWEDTGRSKGSSLGPNISDVTIQAHVINDKGDLDAVAMPVVRYPNFTDKTADLSPKDFKLVVGNESNSEKKTISLSEYLSNFRNYLSVPSSWKGESNSLLSPRDTHVLVSAQATFLPIPKSGKAFFNPVIFNYQSAKESPAVLTILATREGTSATIIDNSRDAFKGFARGQRLFFNKNGEKSSLTGERKKEFLAKTKTQDLLSATANNESGLNMVLLIQVPLIHKNKGFLNGGLEMMTMKRSFSTSSIDDAVIGHGPVEGPFSEVDGLEIKRDHRFPVRVTVQFYKAHDQASISENDVIAMKKQIDKVYKNADYVGSLVSEGKTLRPTEHNVRFCYPHFRLPDYYALENKFNTNEHEVSEKLTRIYGPYWRYFCTPQNELFLDAVKTVLKN